MKAMKIVKVMSMSLCLLHSSLTLANVTPLGSGVLHYLYCGWKNMSIPLDPIFTAYPNYIRDYNCSEEAITDIEQLAQNSLSHMERVSICKKIYVNPAESNYCDYRGVSAEDKSRRQARMKEVKIFRGVIDAEKRKALGEDLRELRDIAARQNKIITSPALFVGLSDHFLGDEAAFNNLKEELGLPEDLRYEDIKEDHYADIAKQIFNCNAETLAQELNEGAYCDSSTGKKRFEELLDNVAKGCDENFQCFGQTYEKSGQELVEQFTSDIYRQGSEGPASTLGSEARKVGTFNTLQNLVITIGQGDPRLVINKLNEISHLDAESEERNSQILALTHQILQREGASMSAEEQEQERKNIVAGLNHLIHYSLPGVDPTQETWREQLYGLPLIRSQFADMNSFNEALQNILDNDANGEKQFTNYRKDQQVLDALAYDVLRQRAIRDIQQCEMKKNKITSEYCDSETSSVESEHDFERAHRALGNEPTTNEVKETLAALENDCHNIIDVHDRAAIELHLESDDEEAIAQVCSSLREGSPLVSEFCGEETPSSAGLSSGSTHREQSVFRRSHGLVDIGKTLKVGGSRDKRKSALERNGDFVKTSEEHLNEISNFVRRDPAVNRILDSKSIRPSTRGTGNYVRKRTGRLDPTFDDRSSDRRVVSSGSNVTSGVMNPSYMAPTSTAYRAIAGDQEVIDDEVDQAMSEYRQNPSSFDENTRRILDELQQTKDELAALQSSLKAKEKQAAQAAKEEQESGRNQELDQEIAALKRQLAEQQRQLQSKNERALAAIRPSPSIIRPSTRGPSTRPKVSPSDGANTVASALPSSMAAPASLARQPAARGPRSSRTSTVSGDSEMRLSYGSTGGRSSVRVTQAERAKMVVVSSYNPTVIKEMLAKASGPVIVQDQNAGRELLCQVSRSDDRGFDCAVIESESGEIADDAGLKQETLEVRRSPAARHRAVKETLDDAMKELDAN